MSGPFEVAQQDLGIRRVDVDRLEKDYRSHQEAKLEVSPELQALVEYIIAKYNRDHPLPRDPNPFKKIDIPQEKWNAIDTKSFSIFVYWCPVEIANKLSNMLSELGAKVEYPREVSYLFLLFRVHNKTREIFALCSGKRGFQPVNPFADYTFPRKIALRLLQPDERSKEKSKRVIGPVLSSSEVFRSQVAFDPSIVEKIYTQFTMSLRRNASLHQFKWFCNKKGVVPKKTTELEILEGTLHIHKSLPFSAFLLILDHFATISRGEETYLHGKEKVVETDAVQEFAFLSYFTPVSSQLFLELEERLLEELANAIVGNKNLDWTFFHPKTEDYLKAKNFRLRVAKKGGVSQELPWEGYRKTLLQILASLRKMPQLQLKVSDLKRELSHVSFDFYKGGEWNSAPLVSCLIGQVQVNRKTYFKLNSKWFEISSNLLAKVDEEFRKMIGTHCIKEKDEGFLPHPWQSKALDLTVKDAASELKVKEEDVRGLCKVDVSYVSDQGKVLQVELTGEILSHPYVGFHKKGIEELLKGGQISSEMLEKKWGISTGKIIWAELIKKRKVADLKTVTRKNKQKEVMIVQNPFLPTGHALEKKIEPKLKEWAQVDLFTMKEGPYNEGYLYHVNNSSGNHQPYKMTDKGWIVGDRIEPEGIELFDILHYTEDTLYLYHVKESFGQKTRDACSQILNSLRMLAKTSNRREEILDLFYDMAVKKPEKGEASLYKEKTTIQMQALGKENFKKLFDKKIVFVYAFVDDRETEHQITKKKELFTESDFTSEKTKTVASQLFAKLKEMNYLTKEGKKGSKFSDIYRVEAIDFKDSALDPFAKFAWHVLAGEIGYFSSLIGRMDLLHTRAQVEGLEMGFKICQIKRPLDFTPGIELEGMLSWEGLDESTRLTFGRETEEPVFYKTSWFLEQECLVIKKTKGEGACGFHALLGVEKEGEIQCDGQTERAEFVKRLTADLNPAKNGFNSPVLNALYEANMTSLIEEAEKPAVQPGHPGYLIRTSAQMVLSLVPNFQGYLNQHFYAEKIKKMKEIVTNKQVKTKGDFMIALRGESSSQEKLTDFQKALVANEEKLLDAINNALPKLIGMSKNKTHSWLTPELGVLSKNKQDQEAAKKQLLTDPMVMQSFLKCLLDANYWLTDDEMQMLAHVHQLRLEIVCKDVVGGNFGCNNQLVLSDRNTDQRPLVRVHSDHSHYSRCELFQ